VCDLGSKALIVHEENVDFPSVFHEEFLETIGEKMARLEMKY
jgi:hypothetical protein